MSSTTSIPLTLWNADESIDYDRSINHDAYRLATDLPSHANVVVDRLSDHQDRYSKEGGKEKMSVKRTILILLAVGFLMGLDYWRHCALVDDRVRIIDLPKSMNRAWAWCYNYGEPQQVLWRDQTPENSNTEYSIAIGKSQIHPWGTMWRQSFVQSETGMPMIIAIPR
jgi:hypothetical protein